MATLLTSDKVLVDKWLVELGIIKIGARVKFLAGLQQKLDNIDKAKEDVVKDNPNVIYLKEYDRYVPIRQPWDWPTCDQYKAMIAGSDSCEAMDDMKQTNGTIGVVVSLLLTMVFLQNGRDVTPHAHSLWKDNPGNGQDLLTFCLAITSVICVCVILFTTRIYLALSMLPNNAGRLAMCFIGGDYALSYANSAFVLFAITYGLSMVVWASIVLDEQSAVVLIGISGGLIVVQLLMCGFNDIFPRGTVDMRFENALAFLYPHAKPAGVVAREQIRLWLDWLLSRRK